MYLESQRTVHLLRSMQFGNMSPKAICIFLMPVSYTHLDVYKRQGQYKQYKSQNPGIVPTTFLSAYLLLQGHRHDLSESIYQVQVSSPVPVSYTHLDVYKRQAWDWVRDTMAICPFWAGAATEPH